MWRLWNFLFGWDYISWKNTADQGIARVYKEEWPTERVFYVRYKITQLIDVINNPEQVVWLTCSSNKYF